MKIVLMYVSIFTVVICLFFVVKNTSHITFSEIEIFKKDSVSVLNFGDVMFDRGVRNIIENRGRDPFEYIKKDLNRIRNYDVVIANLEGPIVTMSRSDCQQKAYNFQFASDTPERLKSIGINMVTIANNHSYDCYSKGFESTKKNLLTAHIDYMGDSNVEKSFVLKEINGKKIAFVGIDRTVSGTSIGRYYSLVQRLKSENDYVVVDIHWGTEYSLAETDEQEYVAHGLIDNGVDVIFGHHPHVIEPVRIYKGKVIFYSLGNFVFDQTGVHETEGVGAGVEFGNEKTVYAVYPYKIKLFAPEFLNKTDEKVFCDNFLRDIKHTGCTFEIQFSGV